MQEPEIFEQPVGSKDPDTVQPTSDDNHTYHTGLNSGFQSNSAEDASLDDYHDFVYPEGWCFSVAFLLLLFLALSFSAQPCRLMVWLSLDTWHKFRTSLFRYIPPDRCVIQGYILVTLPPSYIIFISHVLRTMHVSNRQSILLVINRLSASVRAGLS